MTDAVCLVVAWITRGRNKTVAAAAIVHFRYVDEATIGASTLLEIEIINCKSIAEYIMYFKGALKLQFCMNKHP